MTLVRSFAVAACLASLAGALAGCREPVPAAGPWRGEITLHGQQVPFNFEIQQGAAGLAVRYLNAADRVSVEDVRWDGRELQLNFPSYSSRLTARLTAGVLRGEIELVRPGRRHRLPFTAQAGATYRFFAEPDAQAADFGGRWAMQLGNTTDGTTEPAVAIFEQRGAALTGTVMLQSGDYRYLQGDVRGRRFALSAFDGGGVQLWQGELAADGSTGGTLHTVTSNGARWTARRDAAARLADPATLTTMRAGVTRLEFSFPELDGGEVSLADERFRGKVVLVILAGSWCANCHDEARTMGPIYAAYRDRGLEVVYLMYEYTDRFVDAAPQMRAYRERYDITAPMLYVGSSARDTRGRSLPMLNDVYAFPTTIFVDRRGDVRKIHTAFAGPATGAAHVEYQREFRATVESLLAEAATRSAVDAHRSAAGIQAD
jgi:peroxiredoxin